MPTVNGRLSILPPDMYGGLMFISGWRGVGKSLLATQADMPDNICFIDLEDKGEGWDQQLSFGAYHAPVKETANLPTHMVWRRIEEIVDQMKQDRFVVAVLDNISVMEASCTADVQSRPQEYSNRHGFSVKFIKNDTQGQQRACVNLEIVRLVSRLHSRGVKLVIAISHLGEYYYAHQVVPNRMRVKGRSRWQDLSILTLILGKGDYPPVPSAIVQKEQLGQVIAPDLSDPEVVERIMRGEVGHTVRRRLPERIPHCTFQDLRRYLVRPADLNAPEEGEESRLEEIEWFKRQLTKEQIAMVQTSAEIERELAEADSAVAAAASSATAKKNPGGLGALLQKQAAEKPNSQVDDLRTRITELEEENLNDDELLEKLVEEGASRAIARKAIRLARE